MCGAVPLAAIGEDEFRDVLGTCVACKACKTECPAGVDMAALKVEWLAELRAREGVPLLARGIGDFRRLAGLAAPVAPLVNRLGRTRAARLRDATALGVAHERPLPAFARRPLTRRLRGPARRPAVGRRGRTATLFVDCFIQYQEPGIGEALARLLAAAGVRLELADVGCCGRTALSTGQIDKARAAARRALDGLLPARGRPARERAVRRAVLPLDGARRLGAPAAARRARRRGRGREQAGARAGRRAGRGGPPALPCRRPRPAAQPLPREGARLRRRHAGARCACVPGLEVEDPDAGCCGMSGVFGYEAEPLRAERGHGRARAAAGGARGAAGDGRAGDRHLVPVAGRRPRRPRRRPPARVPRRPPRWLTRLAGGLRTRDRGAPRRPGRPCTMTLVNWVILIAGVAGLLVAGYGLVALVRHALRTRRYGDIAIAVVVVVAVVVLLVSFGDRLIR